jgi:hypothetical protein
MFLPGSVERQAWHFLKTRRPAEASPVVDAALGGAGVADCPVVAFAGETPTAITSPSAIWNAD